MVVNSRNLECSSKKKPELNSIGESLCEEDYLYFEFKYNKLFIFINHL